MGRRCLLGMLAAGLLFAALAMAKNSPQNAASSRVDRILEGMGPLGARGGMPQGQTIDARHIARTARGYVGTLVAPPGQHFKGHAVVPGRPADTARDFLKKYRDEFGMRGPTSDLTLKGVDTRAAHSHVQFSKLTGIFPYTPRE